MNIFKIKKIIVPLFIIFISFQACYYDKEEILYPELSSTCDILNVTYTENVASIISLRCLSCHSNSSASAYGNGVKLEKYSDIKTYVDNGKLLGSIQHASGFPEMPKGSSKMDNCKIKQIEIWVESGANNN